MSAIPARRARGSSCSDQPGEAILLSDQERRDVLKSSDLAAASPEKVMVAGTGIESAMETLRLTEYAAELGYDAAMIRTPHYYKKQMHAGEPGRFLSHGRGPIGAAHRYLQFSRRPPDTTCQRN